MTGKKALFELPRILRAAPALEFERKIFFFSIKQERKYIKNECTDNKVEFDTKLWINPMLLILSILPILKFFILFNSEV